MSPEDDFRDWEEPSSWRERLLGKRRCPHCHGELPNTAQTADPDKLFLFGFLFVVIGVAACAEGYASSIFILQICLGLGIIGWGVFRYREMRKQHRRSRRHRSTPRLADVLAEQGASAQPVTPARNIPSQPASPPPHDAPATPRPPEG